MPIVRRSISLTKWEKPETMIREFIDKYELILEGQPNQIIYGSLFPYSSPDSIFIYRSNFTLWFYQEGDYKKDYSCKVGTIVPFTGDPTSRGVATSVNPNFRPWAICDGNRYNNIQTPDMRGRGFIGIDSSDSGSDNCSLQENLGCTKGNIAAAGNYAGADFLGLKEIHLPPHVHFYRSPEKIAVGGQNTLDKWEPCYYCIPKKKGGCECRGEFIPYPNTNTAINRQFLTRITSSLSAYGWTGETFLNSRKLTTPTSGPHPNLSPYLVLNWKMFVGY